MLLSLVYHPIRLRGHRGILVSRESRGDEIQGGGDGRQRVILRRDLL